MRTVFRCFTFLPIAMEKLGEKKVPDDPPERTSPVFDRPDNKQNELEKLKKQREGNMEYLQVTLLQKLMYALKELGEGAFENHTVNFILSPHRHAIDQKSGDWKLRQKTDKCVEIMVRAGLLGEHECTLRYDELERLKHQSSEAARILAEITAANGYVRQLVAEHRRKKPSEHRT